MSVEKITAYLKEYSYLKSIQALLHWDLETVMPPGALEDRAARLAYIQEKIHAHLTAKKYARLLEDAAHTRLSALEKKLLRELRWDYDLNAALPATHVRELAHAQTVATHVWAGARKKNDWTTFRPHLDKLIRLKRRETGFFSVKKPYDALIRLHDKELTSAEISALFDELKAGLEKLTRSVGKTGKFLRVKELKGPFPIHQQVELSKFAAKVCGLPEEFSRLDVSAHPFSINISPLDQRITTRFDPGHLDSLGSTMHEVGHALYEHQLPRDWEGTPFQEAISLSVHESQSRLWENVIGRSREFCEFLHPTMERLFPRAMKGISPEDLFIIFNQSRPGLIRVESPELYYNQHIIIRYEIEELLFNQGLSAAEIPELWNEKYETFLGVRPQDYATGVMQDSHWAGAAFGYFPTYTVGNLISGTIYRQLKSALPGFREDIRTGELSRIRTYLGKTIHSLGRSTTAGDLFGKLGVKDYISYLSEKFKD